MTMFVLILYLLRDVRVRTRAGQRASRCDALWPAYPTYYADEDCQIVIYYLCERIALSDCGSRALRRRCVRASLRCEGVDFESGI
jgi:hypothetical protein